MPLVVDSWVDSYRTSHAAGMIAMEDFAAVYEAQVRKVLSRPGVDVWVAYHPGEEAPHDLYGWLAVDHSAQAPHSVRKRVDGQMRWVEEMAPLGCPYVLYCFTKVAYRQMGIARGLFGAAGIDLRDRFATACKTGISTQLEREKGLHSTWMPLLVRYPKK